MMRKVCGFCPVFSDCQAELIGETDAGRRVAGMRAGLSPRQRLWVLKNGHDLAELSDGTIVGVRAGMTKRQRHLHRLSGAKKPEEARRG